MSLAYVSELQNCTTAVLGRRHCFRNLSCQLALSLKQHRAPHISSQRATAAPVCAARSDVTYAIEGATDEEVPIIQQAAENTDERSLSSSANGASTAQSDIPKWRPQIDENDPARAPYHRRLLATAKDGRPQDAIDVILSMEEAGLPPGPRAYHGLICAHCKHRDTDSALAAVRQAVQRDLKPIAETYMVLMHTFIAVGDKSAAFKVFQSMIAAVSSAEVQKGWLLLCKDCSRYGFGEDVYAWYKRGSHEGWRPDADMYEMLLSWMCTQENLVDEAETIIRKEMPEAGIQPTTRHANPLVFAEAMFVSVNTAINGPLKEMQQGRLGVGCRPNADSYNCIIMGCLKHVQEDGNAVYEMLQEIKGDMIIGGVKFNKTTHSLFVQVYLLQAQVEFAMLAFEDMAKLARPGAVTEHLTDDAISDLIFALARTNQPMHLIRVLETLVGDRRPLPANSLVALGVAGLSFVASWVPPALDSKRTMQDIPGLLKETEKEEEDYEEIDGTMIGPGGSAVTDDGAVISASKLTVPQLKAELTARGLSTDGKRQDLYRRVQAARSTAPREVSDAVRAAEKRAAQKTVREETALKTKIAKHKQQFEVEWLVEKWKDGQLVSTETVIDVEEDPDADDGDWDEDDQGVPQKIVATPGADFDGEEGDLEPMDAQQDYDQAVKTQQPWWPQDQLISDMALKLALMVEQLGQSASDNDWTQIARAAQWEDNLEAANEVVLRIPELAEYIAVPDDTRLLETFEEADFTISGADMSEPVQASM